MLNMVATYTTAATFMCYVITPSPSGLQGLLNICAKFGLENDVEYNSVESLCMVFKPSGFHLKCTNIHILT